GPAMSLSSVDLPLPLGPNSPTIRPAGSSKLTPRSASARGNRLCTLRKTTIGSPSCSFPSRTSPSCASPPGQSAAAEPASTAVIPALTLLRHAQRALGPRQNFLRRKPERPHFADETPHCVIGHLRPHARQLLRLVRHKRPLPA